MSVLRLLAAALVAVVGLTTVVAPPVRADASDEVAQAQAEADAVALAIATLETDLALLEDEIARLESESAAVRAELEVLEAQVRDIAVRRYVNLGIAPTPVDDDPLAVARADALLGAVADDVAATVSAYAATRDQLDAATGALADRQDDQDAARQALLERLVELDLELSRLDELRRAEQRRRADELALLAATEAESEPAADTDVGALDPPRVAGVTAPPTVPSAPAAPTAPPNTAPSSTAPSGTAPPTTAAPTTTTSTTAPTTTTTTAPASTTTTTAPARSGSGSTVSILCPVQGPSAFVDTWGAPRSGGRTHRGVDMLAPIGTPVVAVVGGRVEHRFNTLGGNSYHLYGNDGNYYYGTHMSAYGASGQVAAGTVIGYVGDTGNAAGIPHLHFEIHPGGGSAINPYPATKAACG